jgi:hypothetical protein
MERRFKETKKKGRLKKERRQERNKRGRVGSLFNYTSSI